MKAAKLLNLYRKNPDLYAEQVLGAYWWPVQVQIAKALIEYKKVLVKASHSVGKTHIAGGLVNWFYDCFDPSIVLTTAPTKAQVEDLLWKEVRVQRKGRPGLLPKSARLESAPNHYAAGYTANDADSFQGRHEADIFIIFDEAVGVDAEFWHAAEGMLTGENCYWLCIFNPTDTASMAYLEEQSGSWHVIEVSALDHPNISEELEGRPPIVPAAVRLSWVEERIRQWCTPLTQGDTPKKTDVEWPPSSGQFHRPGPLFESRVLGRWPSSGTNSVWSDAAWLACLESQPLDLFASTEIGCDVARFGDDDTTIHVRRGNVSLHHETHNGWNTSQTAGRLKEIARQFAREAAVYFDEERRETKPIPAEDPKKIAIKIDDDGVGGGVVDQAGDYNFIACSSAENAIDAEGYPNRRSEAWFASAERAVEGRIDVSRLPKQAHTNLRQQLMAPTWSLDSQGRRVVEKKDDTKKRIKRSPDDADAFNLAYGPTPRKKELKVWTL